jgi:hypothetical protein
MLAVMLAAMLAVMPFDGHAMPILALKSSNFTIVPFCVTDFSA